MKTCLVAVFVTQEQSSVAGMTATQGPTLAGCTLTSKTELTLHFNKSLLGTEQLLTRTTVRATLSPKLSSSHNVTHAVCERVSSK